ncbi:MAG: tetratricopeptide repeat protein [Saprospiraceae bacterium]
MAKKLNKQDKPIAAKNDIKVKATKQKLFIWPILAAVVITFLCFLPSLKCEFVNWDDDKNFYENNVITEVNKANFWNHTKKIFTTGVIGNYNPLPIWTFAIEKIVFGLDNPSRWHLNNLLLHLLCVVLAYRLAILLGLKWQGALIVSLLFGIHPMRVESVAWVTERKDVLFGAFYLGALIQYVKFKSDEKASRWIWMTILFLLSLFSKIQAVSLPLSMMAIDYFLDKKWEFKSIISKIPFFILSLIFGIIGILTLKEFGSLESAATVTVFNPFQRLFIGSYSFMIYLIKLLVPFRLSPLYPYPNYIPIIMYVSMIMLPITLYLLYFTYKTERKSIFFGLIFFIVNIIFLLQILGAGQGFLADRFTYIAYFGLFFITGYYFDYFLNRNSTYANFLSAGVALYLSAMAFITYNQTKVWTNSETLWTHVLKYYKNTTLPYGNRANYLRDEGKIREALSDYNSTLSMKPDQPGAYNSRGKLYFGLAKGQDTLLLALDDYNKAIQYDSTEGEYWVNRGATYARLGQLDKSIADFNKGLLLKPDHAVGYMNRSIIYQNLGRIDLAIQDIDSYLRLIPTNSDLWYEKGRALRLVNKTEEAIVAYSQAINLNNAKGIYFYERSRAYFTIQKMQEAKADLGRAINLGFRGDDPLYLQQMGY